MLATQPLPRPRAKLEVKLKDDALMAMMLVGTPAISSSSMTKLHLQKQSKNRERR